MHIRIGSLEMWIETDKIVEKNKIMSLTLDDLIKTGIRLKYVTTNEVSPTMKTEMIKKLIEKLPKKDYTKDVRLLRNSGLSYKTIVMIARRVLHYNSTSKGIEKDFAEIEEASAGFLSRKIIDDVWILLAAPVTIPYYGQQICVVGLTRKKQLVILALSSDPPVSVFDNLVRRGIDKEKVELGVLSFHLGAVNEFREVFPKAQVGLDWNDLIDLTVGAGSKLRIKQVMVGKDQKEITELVNNLKAPQEMLTFMNFPRETWRVVSTTTSIQRIEKDLRSKLRGERNKAEYDLIRNWALIRLQYHWYKIPVDAHQLYNLRYLQGTEQISV